MSLAVLFADVFNDRFFSTLSPLAEVIFLSPMVSDISECSEHDGNVGSVIGSLQSLIPSLASLLPT